jgi:dipeptidyl aminopeptidase/acylaminoacyl peptidase
MSAGSRRLALAPPILLAGAMGLAPAWAEERHELQPGGAAPGPVEVLVEAPDGEGPFPAILFVHGHQSAPRPGARAFTRLEARPALATIDEGRLARMRDRGYVAAAVSLPGYGESAGPPDFCGPRSQAAVRAAIDHLVARPDVDGRRLVVYGVSRGAISAAMEATTDGRIAGLVLVAGLYDLAAAYPTGDRAVDANVEREAGVTPEALAARSPLRAAGTIRARVLLLHGADDRRGGAVDTARRLAARLLAAGTPVRLRIFASTPHAIPIERQWSEIDPFLARITAP